MALALWLHTRDAFARYVVGSYLSQLIGAHDRSQGDMARLLIIYLSLTLKLQCILQILLISVLRLRWLLETPSRINPSIHHLWHALQTGPKNHHLLWLLLLLHKHTDDGLSIRLLHLIRQHEVFPTREGLVEDCLLMVDISRLLFVPIRKSCLWEIGSRLDVLKERRRLERRLSKGKDTRIISLVVMILRWIMMMKRTRRILCRMRYVVLE